MTAPRIVTELPKLAPREAMSHKGSFGRVLILAGSRNMSGAAILSGMGALRGGAGLVQVAVPREIQPIVASYNPCYLTLGLPQDQDGYVGLEADSLLFDALLKADVLAVGPGLGQSPEIRQLLRNLLTVATCPVVVDADGLNGLAGLMPMLDWAPAERRWIFTPHPMEFARLRGVTVPEIQAEREAHAVAFAAELGIVLVLKGHRSLVTDGESLYRNTTGNPGMATGGTGDVLTGLIAALVGQGLDCFEAAQLGVYLHGHAGDLAKKEVGEVSLIAEDLLSFLPNALRT